MVTNVPAPQATTFVAPWACQVNENKHRAKEPARRPRAIDKVVFNVGDDVRSLILSGKLRSETPYVVSYNILWRAAISFSFRHKYRRAFSTGFRSSQTDALDFDIRPSLKVTVRKQVGPLNSETTSFLRKRLIRNRYRTHNASLKTGAACPLRRRQIRRH